MTKIKTIHYPQNAGRKYCALCEKNDKKRTGWGNSEEESVKNAEEKF